MDSRGDEEYGCLMSTFFSRPLPAWCRRLTFGGFLLVACLLAIAAVRAWICQGLLFPVRISEASMAPALLGDHWQVTCPNCRQSFAADAQSDARRERMICSHCRQPFDATHSAQFMSGDRVLIDKWSAVFRDPARWQVWAIRDERQNDRLLVKRIVGLPGEQVGLQGGDVYINGRILRKSLAEFRSLAILVDEEDFESSDRGDESVVTVWRDDSGIPGWQRRGDGWYFQSAGDGKTGGEERGWLRYHSTDTTAPAIVRDDYAYNQSMSRRLNDVDDLLLECDLSVTASAILCLRAETPTGAWILTWAVDPPSLELHRDDTLIERKKPPLAAPKGRCQVTFGYWDRQVHMGVDGQPWLIAPVLGEAEDRRPRGTATSLSIGASAGELVLRRLRLLRDVYYERPRGPRACPLPIKLAADQYFLLGDNSPCSIDSRYRAVGPVVRQSLVGRVRRW